MADGSSPGGSVSRYVQHDTVAAGVTVTCTTGVVGSVVFTAPLTDSTGRMTATL